MRSAFSPSLRGISVLFAALLLVELWVALLGTGLKAVDTDGAQFDPGFGTPEAIGEALLTKFLLPFELASLLLLVAAVGAVVLARRRRGTGDAEIQALSVVELVRPEGAGTMKEGVGGIAQVESPSRPEVTAGDRGPEGGW
jgi:NADH-quinone oxidoreductase subunit J